MNGADPHLDAAAYVLHALPPDEEAAFENHLASCGECRREVGDLAARTVELGAAVETHEPSPEVRRRVLRRIATVRQDHVVSGTPRTRPVAVPERRPRLRQKVFKLALAPSLAAAVALAGVAGWQHSLADDARSQVAEARAETDELTGVLSAPDAAISAVKLADGANASVITSQSEERAAFTASDLPRLTGHRVYELWYAKAGQFHPAGMLPGTGGHHAYVLDGTLTGATAVGITIEPAGGSPQPTTAPLSIVRIPA